MWMLPWKAFIDYYLDLALHAQPEELKVAGLKIDYLGGIRYELVEMQLSDLSGDKHYYLRIRASGTEPINRIYIESADHETGIRMMNEALHRLELLTMDCLQKARSPWHLVDMLCQTSLTPAILGVVLGLVEKEGWNLEDILRKIQQITFTLEKRNRKVIGKWFEALQAA
jgi:hypothetical protein